MRQVKYLLLPLAFAAGGVVWWALDYPGSRATLAPPSASAARSLEPAENEERRPLTPSSQRLAHAEGSEIGAQGRMIDFDSLDSARSAWAAGYPRGLGSAVAEARDGHDAAKAYQLAGAVAQCIFIDANLQGQQQKVLNARSGNDRSAALTLLAFYEATKAKCQSLQGEPEQLETEMLRIAAEGGIVGAAAMYHLAPRSSSGNAWNTMFGQIAKDASQGDVLSMSLVARDREGQLVLPERDRVLYLNVLAKLASESERYYFDASLAFSQAIMNANHKGTLPPGVSGEKWELTAEEMKSVLVGPWAVTDAEGLKRIDALVKAAKERGTR